MIYKDALVLKEASMALVGTMTEHGSIIGAIIIAPTKQSSNEEFMRRYINSNLNESFAITPFIDEDVCVLAIDTYNLQKNNVLLYKVLGT